MPPEDGCRAGDVANLDEAAAVPHSATSCIPSEDCCFGLRTSTLCSPSPLAGRTEVMKHNPFNHTRQSDSLSIIGLEKPCLVQCDTAVGRWRGGGTAVLHLVLQEELLQRPGHSQTRSVAEWIEPAWSRQASALNSGG
ncbi:hypothetical protein J3F83DRAFT_726421 [Trichoderma novae-zelandiae]